jgi:hypothetical protein
VEDVNTFLVMYGWRNLKGLWTQHLGAMMVRVQWPPFNLLLSPAYDGQSLMAGWMTFPKVLRR